MELTSLDWVIVAVSLVLCYLPAMFYLRRAGSSTAEFFTSGQSAPWWLVGTSMVATTFSTDTPNLVTDFVRTHGVSYNWVWWAFLLTGMATVFFYAQLWRRSRVLTDLELYELRYSGTSAAAVRGFRAVYLGLFFNIMIMSTVTLAAVKIANVMLGWGRVETIVVTGTAVILFASVSGLWGVLATDLVQFVLAMVGVIAAAYVALHHPAVGGLSGLLHKTSPRTLSLLPDFRDTGLTVSVLVIPLTVQWWSVWYPGAEPGGGSYIAQRILASKNERHALGATLWFNVAHYALRPWPWIIVALSSMLVFPTLDDIRRALPQVSLALIGNDLAYPAMLTLLPAGMKGLLVASLFAAYRSTMETHLNWGASYLVIDFYQRFLRPGRSERHYLWVSRGLTAFLMIACGIFTIFLSTASEAFQLLLSVGAGTGLIYLLRWFWWRINAWSEISAMISSFVVALALFVARKNGAAISDSVALLTTVAVTTVVWVSVTLATAPVDRATLRRFYELTRPAGPGWRAIRTEADLPPSADSFPQMLLGWTAGVSFVYAGLFGAGSFIYGRTALGLVWLALFIASGVALLRIVPRLFTDDPEIVGSEMSAVAAARPVTKAVILALGPDARPTLARTLRVLTDAGFAEACVVIGPGDEAGADPRGVATHERALATLRLSVAIQPRALGSADAVLATEEFAAGELFVVLDADTPCPTDALARLRARHEPTALTADRPTFPDAVTAWLFTSEIFRACRDVPPSPRDTLELPRAVQYAIDVLGMRFRIVPLDGTEPALDPLHHGEAAAIASRPGRVGA